MSDSTLLSSKQTIVCLLLAAPSFPNTKQQSEGGWRQGCEDKTQNILFPDWKIDTELLSWISLSNWINSFFLTKC